MRWMKDPLWRAIKTTILGGFPNICFFIFIFLLLNYFTYQLPSFLLFHILYEIMLSSLCCSHVCHYSLIYEGKGTVITCLPQFYLCTRLLFTGEDLKSRRNNPISYGKLCRSTESEIFLFLWSLLLPLKGNLEPESTWKRLSDPRASNLTRPDIVHGLWRPNKDWSGPKLMSN